MHLISFLTFCSISYFEISDHSLTVLAAALQVNQSLQKLKWVYVFSMYYVLRSICTAFSVNDDCRYSIYNLTNAIALIELGSVIVHYWCDIWFWINFNLFKLSSFKFTEDKWPVLVVGIELISLQFSQHLVGTC